MVDMVLAQDILSNKEFNAQRAIDLVLKPALDIYENGDGESPITDREYDFIKRLAKGKMPAHPFFTGVGADVRGGKIDLPYQMGSLTQVEIGELDKWIRDCRLQPTDTVVIMAKLDGTSGMNILKPQTAALQIAYSRGNGIQGADITRHQKHLIKNLDGSSITAPTPVRGETIIAKQTFIKHVQPNFKRSDGSLYKNPRNAVAGMMNASENDPKVYQHIDYVAYQRLDRPDMDKEDQLIELEDMGFKVPWYDVVAVSQLTEASLMDTIDTLRDKYDYEIDGVVVEVNSAKLRAQLDPTALNPGYAMKYKTASSDNYVETEVVEIEWNVSKTRYAKPRFILKPCQLPGITCTHATGYNAKYIRDNNIGPGSIVGVSRKGDVVPNVIRVIKSTKAQLPEFEYDWNETGVDIVAVGDEHHNNVLIEQLTEAARSLDIDGLRDGTAKIIVESGDYDSFNDMFSSIAAWPRNWWTDLIGANGGKIFDDFHLKLSGVQMHVWLGSMPHFGRGVGKRKMKKLFEGLSITTLNQFNAITEGQICSVEGFQEKTAYKILAGMDEHAELWTKVKSIVEFQQKEVSGAKLTGQKICITGFRDGALEALIEAEGGEVQTGVSAKTTIVIAVDIKGNSGKLKKAKDLIAAGKVSIKLMDVVEFRKTYVESPTQNTNVEF